MEKPEIRPLATPIPLNRSSPEVAHVIRSWIPTHMQNLVAIPRGVSFSCMCEFAHQKCSLCFFYFRVLPTPHSRGPEPIFTQNTSNDAVPCKDVSFRGCKTKNLTFIPLIPEKTAILGPILVGLRKFSPENRFTMGFCHVNPLNHRCSPVKVR